MTEAEAKTKTRKPSKSTKKKTTTAKSANTNDVPVSAHCETECLTADARQNLIEEAAYRRAEARNFDGDMALEDWLEAEAEINENFPAAAELK
ncbi:DUF2934 domain-containing protein [Teredinibacter haidensis]|jgi:hypothetical protein|uniref:DUF2934 domain-containing protein n=1 Tax=Teredinibacter haidensis TaxID=2731755 RepID=UPI000948A2EA|nr:DUF2934 domain-containing protein [Teredinibacter haidensis]